MLAGRQGAGCVQQRAFADDATKAELVGALTAQELHPTEQINRCCFRSVYFREPGGVLFEIATDAPRLHRRRAERDPGQRDQVAALVWVPPRRDRGGAATASLIAGAAKRRSARRWSRKILFCAPGAGFIPSPRARARSNYVCARGCEGNKAFIVGGYRREYWR